MHGFGGETRCKQTSEMARRRAPTDQAQCFPDHGLIAGHNRKFQPRFQIVDHAENRDIRAADQIGIGIGTCRGEDAVVPELRRCRAIGIAAVEREPLCRKHIVAGLPQKIGSVVLAL